MIHELGKQSSLLSQYLAEIRDESIQKDRMRFRRNLERIGELLGYEVSKTLEFETKEVTTPLGVAEVQVLKEQPVLATILRAGLPMHHGLLNVFDNADNAFVSAYRRYHKSGEFEIEVEYSSSHAITDRTLIIADPLIATGSRVELVYKSLLAKGIPLQIHVISAISSNQGITHLRQRLPAGTQFWTVAMDHELTARAYIVPGLGDAGDLAYGTKG
jgi:uracil phosphoribosyltransferase